MSSVNFCVIFTLLFALVIKTNWIQALELYDITTQVCCLGKVHPAPESTEEDTNCCGDTSYDAKQYMCCHNEVLPRPTTESAYCCGTQVYTDVSTSMCCDDILVDLQTDNRFNNSNQGTTEERIVASCCGQNVYNVQTEMCCNSGVVPRPFPSAKCCGDAVYDGLIEICCQKTVHRTNGKNFFCCDSEAYDAVSSLCCKGVIHSKPELLTTDVEVGERTGVITCCGAQTMDVDKDICCEDQVITIEGSNATECCSTSAYDPETQLCCDGIPQSFIGADQDMNPSSTEVPGYKSACCGSQTYSIDKQVCCNGVVHQLDTIPANRPIICCGSDLLINTNLDICCNERVMTKRTQNTRCCGSTTYESDRQICCKGDVIRTKGSDTELCCGDVVFDYNTQLCCFEGSYQVLAIDKERTSCCAQPSTVSNS